MHNNRYTDIVDPKVARLIVSRARRMRINRDEIDDLQQRIVPMLAKFQFDEARSNFELYATGQYTFKEIADAMEREGYTYQPSYPRFHRTALSYILNNRFYIGMITFRGRTFPGKHRPIIDLEDFEQCQALLKGKNRRVRKANHYLAGGMFTCAHCGYGITGERIRRRMRNGNVHEYIYYRCGNLKPDPDHPTVRWRQEQLEEAIAQDLETLRIPDDKRRQWFRDHLETMCEDDKRMRAEQIRQARKRLTELEQMQQRLLDGYLAGVVEKDVFGTRSAEMKAETERLQDRLADGKGPGTEVGEFIMTMFDVAQNAAEEWRVSQADERRELLRRVLLKRSLSATSLVTTKKRPFDVFAEGPKFDQSRGDRIPVELFQRGSSNLSEDQIDLLL